MHNKKWKGYRLIAIDGSYLNLPNSQELKDFFGTGGNHHDKLNMALSSFAFDISNELILDSIIVPVCSSELDLAVAHLEKLNPQTDILIFDRGYPAMWLIGLLVQKGFKFCFRMNSCWRDVKSLVKSNQQDISWTMTNNSKNKANENLKKYNIPSQIEGLRLTKILLSTGEYEVLATNLLDKEVFDIEILKDLYNKRWGIEETFKTLKKALFIESFSGKSVLAIKQDFYAKILMLNLSSIIRNQFVEPLKKTNPNTKFKSKLNKTQALAKTKDFLINIFKTNNILELINTIKKILDKCFDIIRPNRSFQRRRSGNKPQKNMTLKGI